MDLNYLVEEVLTQRKKEIEQGKNLSTRQPIYVVLDLQENYTSGHTDYSLTTNYKDVQHEHGYLDDSLESEAKVFKKSVKGMRKPEEVTRFYTDRIIAFFLTSKAAHEYLQYQKHNLSNGYVYVFYSGYGNYQMDMLLKNQ
jgi:hypothetical protein